MSARYEISEGELDVLAITGPEGTRYIDGEEIEARAIRQQARDIAELRAELAAAVAERDEARHLYAKIADDRDVAEARLAAIDAAPTLCWQDAHDPSDLYWRRPDPAQVETRELIARPAKDKP